MLPPDEMRSKAEQCDRMAAKARDEQIAFFFREAADHWRAMAAQLDLLEQEQVYRIIRGRSNN
ncbi:hypothetical protein BRAS3843_770020 [Bradyrhizobium sp. STM 3843]|uniref:hypothetical protein n=1 Tax=Bradyrhizobium sp. STM 3843 TaxID=551947 RepID=UPI0002404A1F|nr:hypothetical protein [Bradyrhizobium sp. STM 3843]CCE11722.1 hypothetical protein BRAS3843_770020 [Bradyrhizobium sp. STM 3843]